MKKIKLILSIGIVCATQFIFAQETVSQQVIASAGGYNTAPNLQVSWTLGETAITAFTSESLSLSQGFQQNTNICVKIVDYKYVKAGNPYKGLFQLYDGIVINQLPDEVSILVSDVCSNIVIESFEMNLQGPETNWNIIQNISPNSIFDNLGNNVFGKKLIAGKYTLTVTGYTQDNKGGLVSYGPVITNFIIVGDNATISTPTLQKSKICAGSSLDVTFFATGNFSATNKFQVQLSTPSGNFDTFKVIGESPVAGTVSCQIPANIPEGEGYLIRIVSTNQVLLGEPTLSAVQIKPTNSDLRSPVNDFMNQTATKQAVNTISASNKIQSTAKIEYEAGKAILLKNGFEVQVGSVFKAQIQDCL